MAKYLHIGCSPRTSFPDTFTLTILERYYQPITLPDSLQTTIPVTVVKTPSENRGFTGTTRQTGSSSITVFMIFGLILLAVIKHHFAKNLLETFRSAFSFSQSMRLFDERRETDRQATALSNIWFTIVAGIFISLVVAFFVTHPLWDSYALSILFFSFATGLVYFLKTRIWRILGVVFNVQTFTGLYIHYMFLYNRIAGILAFPLVILVPYMTVAVTPYLLYSVITIFALSYLLRLWRFFQIIYTQNVSVFYFILYLCGFEILPLLLFVKSCKMLIELSLFQ